MGWKPLAAAGAAYAVVMCAVVVLRAWSTTDFRDFWQTAEHFRRTGQISFELGVHNYLPAFTILMTPWSLLPLEVALVVFTLLSLGLLAATVWMLERELVGGTAMRPSPATLAALGLLLPYVTSCSVLGALGLVLLFLIAATWHLAQRGRVGLAGVALGLAAVIKLLPAVLIAYFLLARRWRVAVAAAATAGLLGLAVPLLVLGAQPTLELHGQFFKEAVLAHSAWTTIHAERPRKAAFSNNSLPIVLRRLLSPVNGGKSETGELFVNLAHLPSSGIAAVYLALAALFLIGSAAPLSGKVRAIRPPPAAADHQRTVFAQWCCLMLLLSPLMWTHYLVLAYFPLLVLADRVVPARRRPGRPCGVSLAALGFWLFGALLLAWPAARAAGAQLGSVAALWSALTIIALRPVPATPEPPAHRE
jgi:alpha-1,2-mannosyltransferase